MLKKVKNWSEEELNYLIDNYKNSTVKELAAYLNKTPGSVSYAANVNGLIKQPHNSWTEEQIEFLKDNYVDMTSEEIAKKFNRSIVSVNAMRDRLGLVRKPKWTEEEIQILKDNYDKLYYKEIGELLGRSAEAVDAKCFDLGLYKKEKPWEDWEYEYLKKNYMELSNAEIAETLGRSVEGIRLKASRNGWKKSPYFCNYRYFSNIDSEEKAYWLGFLMADGWISYIKNKTSGCVGIELQYRDIGHLRKFNKSLDGNYKITDRWRKCTFNNKYHHSCVLRIYSLSMYKDLVSLGFTKNKSFEALISNIDDDLKRHFIRGYFDGNGSVSIRKKQNGCSVKITTASRKMVDDLIEELNKSGISTIKYESVNEFGTTVYDLFVNGTNSNRIKFLDYIYKDVTIYLDRKYKKYLRIKEQNESKRKPRQSEMTGSF